MQKPKKTSRKLFTPRIVGLLLTCLGAAALVISIIYASQIQAFIGLGLIFWGIIIMYIQSEEYVKQSVMNAATRSSLTTINHILRALEYKGKAIYLPPKYLKDPLTNKVYIPKEKDGKLPTPEQIQLQENKIFVENPKGIQITPPGDELAKLFERILETNFTRIDLNYLEENLPKLLIENLELVQNFEIEAKNNKILVKIENGRHFKLLEENENLDNNIGCPIASAIACALTKALGKPITIQSQQATKDSKKVQIEFQIVKEETIE